VIIRLEPQVLMELTTQEEIAKATPVPRKIFKNPLRHGTSSLYYNHFKVHGISATYPKALEEITLAICKLWEEHQKETLRMTDYFLDFKSRYMQARSKEQKIAMSFSNREEITQEYTTGARGNGGEMMREVRTFLRETSENFCEDKPEKRKIYLQIKALDRLFRSMPPMILEVSDEVFGYNCQNLNYEYKLTSPVKADDINFIILDSPTAQNLAEPCKLEFDVNKIVSLDELISLQIDANGHSYLPQYQDSFFEIVYHYQGSQTIRSVTRKKITEEMRKGKEFAEKRIQNDFIAKLINELGLVTFIKAKKINPYFP
jgi:hypothetical protein